MNFIIPWLCYLAAFLIGSGITWVVLAAAIKPTSAHQAALTTETGARR